MWWLRYRPSDPGSIPARVFFLQLFFFFFFYLHFPPPFFIWVLRPVKIISLILSRINRKVGRRTPRKTTWPSTSKTACLTRDMWSARILSGETFLIFFLLFEFYVTWVDGRFPVKMLIFTIGVIIKTFPQRKHCTQALECQNVWLSQGLCTCQLQLRPIGFEKAKIYRGFCPLKKLLKLTTLTERQRPAHLSQRK